MGLCSNYAGQCKVQREERRQWIRSELQFSCGLPNKNGVLHHVTRIFCSEACERQADEVHRGKQILDVDKHGKPLDLEAYRKLVQEAVQKAKQDASRLQLKEIPG